MAWFDSALKCGNFAHSNEKLYRFCTEALQFGKETGEVQRRSLVADYSCYSGSNGM